MTWFSKDYSMNSQKRVQILWSQTLQILSPIRCRPDPTKPACWQKDEHKLHQNKMDRIHKDTQKVQKWFPDWNKSKRKERRPEVNQSLYRQLKSGDWSAGGCRGRRHKVYYSVKLVKDPLSHCTASKRMPCNSDLGTSPATASTCHRKNFLTCSHTRAH